MKRFVAISILLTLRVTVAGEFALWEPDAPLLGTVEPVLKQHCWNKSDQRRKLSEGKVRVDVDNAASNIVVHVPDISVRDTFTVRGLAYSNYFRRVNGMTDDGFRYLEYLFSPTPITNKQEIIPIEFDSVAMISSSLSRRKTKVKPVRFRVYVDLQEMKAFDRWDWSDHKRKRTSNK